MNSAKDDDIKKMDHSEPKPKDAAVMVLNKSNFKKWDIFVFIYFSLEPFALEKQ